MFAMHFFYTSLHFGNEFCSQHLICSTELCRDHNLEQSTIPDLLHTICAKDTSFFCDALYLNLNYDEDGSLQDKYYV